MMFKSLIIYYIYLISSASLYVTHPLGGRIVGGQLAEPGQFPYIVSVQLIIEGVHYHYCGGSILNSQWIVTAGHCIATPELEYYEIIAGTNLLDTGGVTYNVTTIKLHPLYSLDTYENDIALIQIDGEFEFSNTVASIKIGEITGNESSTTLGWGQTANEDSLNELRFVEVTALSLDDCRKLAEGAYWTDDYPLGEDNVCAVTSEGKGPCHGDSGGPLVHNNTLIGITSHLLDVLCASEYPDVYTNVAYYKKWIDSIISAN